MCILMSRFALRAVKYINKYVYKGSDRTAVAVGTTDDEIILYL
jgi:hypothetical protein